MTAQILPTFVEATTSFYAFLVERVQWDRLVWVFSGDVLANELELRVRTANPPSEDAAAEYYASAARAGLGVQFHAFARAGDVLVCHLWSPRDEAEAERSMIAGLKFSIRTPLLAAKIVADPNRWSRLKQTGWIETAPVLEQLPDRPR